MTPDPMKRLNNTTDNRVLRKQKQKTYAEHNQIHLKVKVRVYHPKLEKWMQKVVRDLLTWKQERRPC